MSVTLAIVVITCAVSVAGFSRPRLTERLLLWPPAITRGGEYWRLLSSGLVHADLWHLAFNMITLYSFGSLMESFYAGYVGATGYLLFYAGGLLVSALPGWLAHRDDASYRSLGASGAVLAILFGFILLRPWAMIFVFIVPVPAIVFALAFLVYTVYMGRRRVDRINHAAHLWGAVYGLVVTVLIEPRLPALFLRQLLHPSMRL